MDFQVLCVTMNQVDMSKYYSMNVNSNVIFANQADYTSVSKENIHGNKVKMVTTQTRGVGCNRNMALLYAEAEICLLADDDVVYIDDMEKTVLEEFKNNPKADVIIFHFDSDDKERKRKQYNRTRRIHPFERKPWAGYQIAFRLNRIRKANMWFSTLFGGGCVFPCGEDSKWIEDAYKQGLKVYASSKTIGKVSFENSTWYKGSDDEQFFIGHGILYEALYGIMVPVWMLYFALRTAKMTNISFIKRIKLMKIGRNTYKEY